MHGMHYVPDSDRQERVLKPCNPQSGRVSARTQAVDARGGLRLQAGVERGFHQEHRVRNRQRQPRCAACHTTCAQHKGRLLTLQTA